MIGFIIGLFCGAILGFFAFTLLMAGKGWENEC